MQQVSAPAAGLRQLLDDWSRHNRLAEIPMKDDNRARLIFDDRVEVFLGERTTRGDVVLLSDVGFYNADCDTDFFAELLLANHNTGSDGPPRPVFPAALCLNEAAGTVVLRDQRALKTLCAERFGTWLAGFVDLAEAWLNHLDQPHHAPNPTVDVDTCLPPDFWRRC